MAIYYSNTVHLITRKTDTISTEVKTLGKNFARPKKARD